MFANFSKRSGGLFRILQQRYHSKRLVLGIESTFDDSGAAVVDEDGNILGDSLRGQLANHKSAGGVKPLVAQKLHEENLPIVVDEAMTRAGVDFKDLSAVATATKPGFSLSLQAGLDISKKLVAEHNLPFIPVHHMEAHALTIRMIQTMEFPFLVLLASGGHCLLCLAQSLGNYKILGKSMDEAPGAMFDKIARELGLLTDKRFLDVSGGQAIEIAAKQGDPFKFPFTVPLTGLFNSQTRSCNFSFSGLQTQVTSFVAKLKERNKLDDAILQDVAASFQETAVRHILMQIQRGIIFCQMKKFLPPESTLVLSGGVAANSYFRESVSELCETFDMKVVCPPKHLCTDNGIMIAWTGMEYLRQGIGFAENPSEVRYSARSPIGEYIGDLIVEEGIKVPGQFTKKRKLKDICLH